MNSNQIQIIGKWNDPAVPGHFYLLYRSNNSIYLNFADVKTIRLILHKIRKDEYVFRDDVNGRFIFNPGTSVYVGRGFEDTFDINGNPYKSTIILRHQNNRLTVYTNDYDRRIYDVLCELYKY